MLTEMEHIKMSLEKQILVLRLKNGCLHGLLGMEARTLVVSLGGQVGIHAVDLSFGCNALELQSYWK